MTASPRNDFTLRFVVADEWPAWRTLRLAALTESPDAFGSTLAQWQNDGDVEPRWRERLSSVPLNIVAKNGDAAVGMVSATKLDELGTTEMISMWVAPAARGTGVGDALVAAVIDWARSQRAARIELDVVETNAHAIALYVRHGFVDIGVSENEDLTELPERRMARDC